jgi:hypothetical protein
VELSSYHVGVVASRFIPSILKTASRERFEPNALTAAHPSLPLGTRVKIAVLEGDSNSHPSGTLANAHVRFIDRAHVLDDDLLAVVDFTSL